MSNAPGLALFDLDGTLIPGDSDHAFGQHMVKRGWAQADTFARANDEFFAHYNQGTLDMAAYVRFATSPWRDKPAAELQAAVQAFVTDYARPALRPEALALVDSHRQRGDLLALVTATNEVVTAPLAELFGIPHLLATRLARASDGRPTGEIAGVPCFREGKVKRVHDWLSGLGLRLDSFERVHFYSDSLNDLPLLEAVSHPVATNPSLRLEQWAQARGWPVLRLFEPATNP
jgi:HAD superfamily hydrolase (TIGR01490 family)